jgi:Radical SAM superfamily
VVQEIDLRSADGVSGVTASMVSGWELGRHTTSIAHRKTLCSIYMEPPEVLFAHQDEALSAHAAPLLLASFPELREAMLATVEGARECLVVMGSRSRDPGYLEAIERALEERPSLTCYRVLFGPPHHQVLKDHLIRLLRLRDPDDRSLGVKTLHIGMVGDIQYRSGQSARIELEHLISTYSIKGFAIVDDNFIVNKAKVGDICDHITGLGLHWSALSRVDTISAALLAKMANSGCIEIKYGMESGSETLLKAMRKNTTREQIRFAVHATADRGIAAKVFIIHGFPGEDDQTTDETISLLTELAPSLARVSLFRFVPLPGTQVYASPDKYGITGTHLQPGWDGDWSAFHIHHNTRRWWGTDAQWAQVESSYRRLRDFVETTWGPQS